MRGYGHILTEMEHLRDDCQGWTKTTAKKSTSQMTNCYSQGGELANSLFLSSGSQKDKQENQPEELGCRTGHAPIVFFIFPQ